MKLGVVGLGNMGTNHAKMLVEGQIAGAELGAVADRNEDRREQYPEAKHFITGDEMIASGEIDGIVIATPHFSHTTLGVAAIEAGLHVLVEKPLSVHKADAERLVEAHKRKRTVFSAMLNMRTNPFYRKIKELVDTGALGELRRVNWIATDWFRTESYYASGSWRATWKGEGGGVLMNQCVHQLDLFQWMFGMPAKVRAFCQLGRYHDVEVEDDVTSYFEYKNGATGVFITSTGEAPGTNRLEVVGDLGKLVFENEEIVFTQNRESMAAFSRTSELGFGVPEAWKIGLPRMEGKGGQHREVMQNFVDCIRDRKVKNLTPAKDGIASVELANAILYSSLKGETVKLPLDAKAYEALLGQLIATSKPKKKVVKRKASASDFNSSFR